MNGPQHYAEAERLLEFADSPAGRNTPEGAESTQIAQVHATLALAAATVETRYTSAQQSWGGTETYVEAHWQEALS